MPTSYADFPLVQAQNSLTSGTVNLWTPSPGTRFRIFAVELELPANTAISGGATELLVSLNDNLTPIPGMDWNIEIPATGATSGNIADITSDLRPNGYASAAVGNILKVVLNATLTAGNLRIRCRGIETP